LKKNFFKYQAQTTNNPISLEVLKADGSFIYDINNKKYLDFHKKFIGVDKNPLGNSGIHSVANVNSGKPTVTRLMIETNKFIGPIYLISQKSILSKWLEVYKCT